VVCEKAKLIYSYLVNFSHFIFVCLFAFVSLTCYLVIARIFGLCLMFTLSNKILFFPWRRFPFHHHHHHVREGLGVFPVPWSSKWSWSLHLFFGRPMFLRRFPFILIINVGNKVCFTIPFVHFFVEVLKTCGCQQQNIQNSKIIQI